MKTSTKIILSAVVLAAVVHFFVRHSGFVLWNHQPMQYMPNMHRTSALKPQRGYAFFEDFSSSRTAPEGTVARGVQPYKFSGSQFLAENVDRHANPLPRSREVVQRGKFMYENNCYVCHGKDGNGKGPIVGAFPNPPSLNSDKIRNYADSQIFHIMTNGQNTMGSYAATVRVQDRWAIAHYVRVLQLADQPRAEDITAFDAFLKKETP